MTPTRPRLLFTTTLADDRKLVYRVTRNSIGHGVAEVRCESCEGENASLLFNYTHSGPYGLLLSGKVPSSITYPSGKVEAFEFVEIFSGGVSYVLGVQKHSVKQTRRNDQLLTNYSSREDSVTLYDYNPLQVCARHLQYFPKYATINRLSTTNYRKTSNKPPPRISPPPPSNSTPS